MAFPKSVWLGATFLVLVFIRLAVWWSERGLITLRAEGMPLAQVAREFERQGRIQLRTDLDLTIPVTLRLKKAPVPEALQTLAAVTESRWHLAYVLAANKTQVSEGREVLSVAGSNEDWLRFRSRPSPAAFVGEANFIFDPRRGEWSPAAPGAVTLQDWLNAATAGYETIFLVPKEWNPNVKISTDEALTPKDFSAALARSAHGIAQEVFYLQKPQRGSFGPNEEADGGLFFDEIVAETRLQQRLTQMPASQRAAAKKEFEEQKVFWQSLRDLSPDQRRAKMRERMSDPVMQEKMDDRRAAREERQTPAQREARYQRYVANKAAVTGH